jgi:hypothetical protein
MRHATVLQTLAVELNFPYKSMRKRLKSAILFWAPSFPDYQREDWLDFSIRGAALAMQCQTAGVADRNSALNICG